MRTGAGKRTARSQRVVHSLRRRSRCRSSCSLARMLFVRTVHALRATDLGLRTDHLLVLALSPQNAGRSAEQTLPFFRAVRETRGRAARSNRRDLRLGPPAVERVVANRRHGRGLLCRAASPEPSATSSDRLTSRRWASRWPAAATSPTATIATRRKWRSSTRRSRARMAAAGACSARASAFRAGVHHRRHREGREVRSRARAGAAGVVRSLRAAGQREVPRISTCVRRATPSGMTASVRAAIAAVDPDVALFEVRTRRGAGRWPARRRAHGGDAGVGLRIDRCGAGRRSASTACWPSW